MIAFLYELSYALPLSVLATALLWQVMGFQAKDPLGLFLCILFPVWICSLFHAAKKLRILLAVLPPVGVGCMILAVKERERLAFLTKNVRYALLLAVAVGGFLLGRLFMSWFAARIAGMLLIVSAGVVAVLVKQPPDKKTVAAGALILMIFAVDCIQEHWKKSGVSDRKGHLTHSMPFLLLLILLVYKIPAPKQPLDWSFLVTLWQNTAEDVKKVSGKLFHRKDGFGVMGFSDKADTATSNSKGKSQKAFLLTNRRDSAHVIYLSGKAFDTFNGREWKSVSETTTNARMLDMLQLQAAVNAYDTDYAKDYYRTAYLEIENRMYNTSYLFLPQKIFLQPNLFEDVKYVERFTSVNSKKAMLYGKKYAFQYLNVNRNTALFSDFLREAPDITEESWNEILRQTRYGGNDALSYAKFQEYATLQKIIYSTPVTMSDATKEFLDGLWEGAESSYEKLLRLQNLLCSGNYTLNSGYLADRVTTPSEFLEEFIVNNRSGYCVHFATAFALAARSLGYPTRYVQGYLVDRRDENSVLVTSEMAHAWAEVYFENIGWVIFETTPNTPQDVGWGLSIRHEKGQHFKYDTNIDYTQYIPQPTPKIEEPKVEKKKDVRLVLLPIAGVLVLLLLYILLGRLIAWWMYRRMSASDKVHYMSRKNMRLLRFLGLPKENSETLSEYAARIKTELPASIFVFFSHYEKVLYSDCEITEAMCEETRHVNMELKVILKTKKKIFRLFL